MWDASINKTVHACVVLLLSQNTGRVQPTKEDREEFKRILLSTHGRLPFKLELFRRYLQNRGDPDSVPKLENDLYFYLEVQKLKVSTVVCLNLTGLWKMLADWVRVF